jgi:hypothetical protein
VLPASCRQAVIAIKAASDMRDDGSNFRDVVEIKQMGEAAASPDQPKLNL